MLVGLALADGQIKDLDQTVRESLPAYTGTMNPQTGTATLEQLLTMTSGLPADPADGSFPSFVHTSDWVSAIVTAPPEGQPGGAFAYSKRRIASHCQPSWPRRPANRPCPMPRPGCSSRSASTRPAERVPPGGSRDLSNFKERTSRGCAIRRGSSRGGAC